MNELTPIYRIEYFLDAIVNGSVNPHTPIYRVEKFLAKIAGEAVETPTPVYRIEKYLAKIAGENVEIPKPIFRVEYYLAKICGEDVETPTPIYRVEFWLNDWANSSDPLITLSGSLVRFTSSASKPFVSTEVNIVPQQSGSGDPSPSNVRPISGWTEVNVWDEATYDPTAQPKATISLGDTVYGGTLTINEDGTATGSDEWAKVVLNGSHSIAVTDWRPATGTSAWLYSSSIFNTVKSDDEGYVISDKLKNLSYANADGIYYGYVGVATLSASSYSIAVRVPVEGLNNSALINAYLAENPIEICYKKATPTTITLTAQQINTLVGENNVWADSGDIEVTVYGFEPFIVGTATVGSAKVS